MKRPMCQRSRALGGPEQTLAGENGDPELNMDLVPLRTGPVWGEQKTNLSDAQAGFSHLARSTVWSSDPSLS